MTLPTLTENLPSLSYRLFVESDMAKVLELWRNHADWGDITEQQFRNWYVDTPYGSSIIIVAETQGGELIAQAMFMPAKALVNKKEVKALRVFAPILHSRFRGISIRDYHHPVYAMFRFGMKMGASQNFHFIYSFPSVGWLVMIRTFTKYSIPLADVATFNCISYSLTDGSTINKLKQCDTSVIVEKSFDHEYDQLWNEATSMLPISTAIIRTKERHRFKLASHLVLAVRSNVDNKLIGYVAVRWLNGLIVDALARTLTDLEIVLHSAIRQLHQHSPGRVNLQRPEVKAILFPATEQVFKSIVHEKVDFKFTFFCSHLDVCKAPANLKACMWYMMPDD